MGQKRAKLPLASVLYFTFTMEGKQYGGAVHMYGAAVVRDLVR